MMKGSVMKKEEEAVFIGLEAALLAAFKVTDAKRLFRISEYLEYAGIVLCFLAVLLVLARTRRDPFPAHEKYLVPLGLALTLTADTFLVLLVKYELAGVIFFCLVETVYAVYLSCVRRARCKEDPSQKRHVLSGTLWLRGGLLAVVTAAVWTALKNEMSVLVFLSAYSMVMLTLNMIESWRACRESPRGKEGRLFAVGITLFFLCDLNVGLYHVGDYFTGVPQAFTQAVYFLIWLFYLPGQVLISLSYVHRPKRKEGEE